MDDTLHGHDEIRTALLILEASRPYENSGPVNPRLLEQACNIGTAALNTLSRLLIQHATGDAPGPDPTRRGVSPDPAPQLLTRNRYRMRRVERPALPGGDVRFVFCVGGGDGVWMELSADQFEDLFRDLGLRPVTPAATEYESVPIGETTFGRGTPHAG